MRLTAHVDDGPYADLWALSAAGIFEVFSVEKVSVAPIDKPDWLVDPDMLLATAERAVKLFPMSAITWGMLGEVLIRQGKDLARAVMCFERGSALSNEFGQRKKNFDHNAQLARDMMRHR